MEGLYDAHARQIHFNRAQATYHAHREDKTRLIAIALRGVGNGPSAAMAIFSELIDDCIAVATAMDEFDSKHAEYLRKRKQLGGGSSGINPYCKENEDQVCFVAGANIHDPFASDEQNPRDSTRPDTALVGFWTKTCGETAIRMPSGLYGATGFI